METEEDLKWQTAENIVDGIDRILDIFTASEMYRLRVNLRDNYSLEFLTYSQETLANTNQDSYYLASGLRSGFSETVIKEAMHFFPISGLTDYAAAIAFLDGIRHGYEMDDVSDLRTLDRTHQKKLIALLRVTEALERHLTYQGVSSYSDAWKAVLEGTRTHNGRYGWYLQDDALIELVTDEHERFEDVIGVVQKHDVTDASSIRGLVQSISPSLARGTL